MKQTDYGLVSCQFERDMIARADKAIKQDKRRISKQEERKRSDENRRMGNRKGSSLRQEP